MANENRDELLKKVEALSQEMTNAGNDQTKKAEIKTRLDAAQAALANADRNPNT